MNCGGGGHSRGGDDDVYRSVVALWRCIELHISCYGMVYITFSVLDDGNVVVLMLTLVMMKYYYQLGLETESYGRSGSNIFLQYYHTCVVVVVVVITIMLL